MALLESSAKPAAKNLDALPTPSRRSRPPLGQAIGSGADWCLSPEQCDLKLHIRGIVLIKRYQYIYNDLYIYIMIYIYICYYIYIYLCVCRYIIYTHWGLSPLWAMRDPSDGDVTKQMVKI